ncbi:RIP metalloprotease RseP [Jatrophihabitans endophyticus]|uniref:RIP metalloprotease RseP n=1 Tax=Jatrophihabitans endophyticus TaxID=1206085 RepID=A0A1M5ME37_9ACTN|nr:site-2 protease family protein [Jatrophihabitans endophyticus]SHG75496.1 RIP metalloprotease RseP [Jatrophihabitans endophyticus]
MPSWLLYTLGVVIFAFGLLLSIALHEVGHMVPAKKFGVKVTQYMVGFGPTMWSRKRGDTEYGLKAVPLGGYIRMIGMVPPRADGRRSRWPRRMATAVEDFRQVSRAEVQPGDEERQFYRLTPGKKMIVMVGGPTMNLLIYLVLTIIVLTTLGVAKERPPTLTITSIEKCVVAANRTDVDPNECPVGSEAPAYRKLQPGDTVLAVDGTPVTSWDGLVSRVETSAGAPLRMTIRRDGITRTVTVTPVRNLKRVVDGKGGTKLATTGYLGVSPVIPRYYDTLSLTEIPGEIGRQLHLGVSALARYPEKIGNLFGTVFQGEKRDPEGAVGVVGIGRISGDLAESKAITTKDKVASLLGLLASVNLLLFFFNLLPLLPLDGGHVAGAIVEAVKRGRARLRARSQPPLVGPDGGAVRPARPQIFVDTAQMLPVMYGVASVLVVLTLLTLYADIVSPIRLLGG